MGYVSSRTTEQHSSERIMGRSHAKVLGSEGIERIQSHRRSKIEKDLCNDFNQ